jgi:uncharacterized protein YndB with AHSA1/START domain
MIEVPSVKKEVVVEASAERAFRVFTDKFDQWWPRDHHIGKAELKAAIIEPRVGGRWYEIGVDDSQCEWGSVLVWDPPRRLVMAWQLNADWQYDPDLVTELELRFITIAPMLTRVELEHRNMERFGERALQMREALDSAGGWITHLTRFAAAAVDSAASQPLVR